MMELVGAPACVQLTEPEGRSHADHLARVQGSKA
jgi:hypothetical protein